MTSHRSNRSDELDRLEDVAYAMLAVGHALQDLRDTCNRQADGRLDAGATACRVLIEIATAETRKALVGPESAVRGMVAPEVSAIVDDDE